MLWVFIRSACGILSHFNKLHVVMYANGQEVLFVAPSHCYKYVSFNMTVSPLMGDSSQLTPLSTPCKQLGPINWIPQFLSLESLLSIASFSLRNLP